jgi:hypothetical protein
MASAALNRDMRTQGRTPKRLGIENIEMILADSFVQKEVETV